MKKLLNAIKFAFWYYKNPQVMELQHFENMGILYGLILNVAKENKPYIRKLATIDVDNVQHELVCVWAGSGIGADPIKRIEELVKENTQLKLSISEYINKLNETQS